MEKLNRADRGHLAGLRRFIAPSRWDLDELAYSPLPQSIPEFAGLPKSILVDLSDQVFGAYESGKLIRWGPVSSGDRQHRTPAGSYNLNWNSRLRISSENPTWIMPWYFNFSSDRGMGLHQYTLPGRPASHGCVRLLKVDAMWLFHWGDGWTMDPETRAILHAGTPVLIVGAYNYRARQPWLKPEWWSQRVKLDALEVARAKQP